MTMGGKRKEEEEEEEEKMSYPLLKTEERWHGFSSTMTLLPQCREVQCSVLPKLLLGSSDFLLGGCTGTS